MINHSKNQKDYKIRDRLQGNIHKSKMMNNEALRGLLILLKVELNPKEIAF